jgi:hypothetical protein
MKRRKIFSFPFVDRNAAVVSLHRDFKARNPRNPLQESQKELFDILLAATYFSTEVPKVERRESLLSLPRCRDAGEANMCSIIGDVRLNFTLLTP